MTDEKYQYEKQQIAEAQKALEEAKDFFGKAKEEYVAQASELINELDEFTQKNRKRISFNGN